MYDQFKDHKQQMEVGNHYRSVLLETESGRKMFTHMLSELGVLESTEGKSERELGRFDYAMRLLEIMSIPSYPNLHRFVNDMAKYPEVYPEPGETHQAKGGTSIVVNGEEA